MKQTFILFSLLALLTACTGKTAKQTAVTDNTESVNTTDSVTVAPTTEEPTSDEVVCKAIADFLGGNDSAVRFTDHARQDLTESSWPEVQCSIDGNLDSPASFKELTVKKVGPGLYKYEAVCPDHGDRYTDCCTLSAYVARDGVVEIEAVTWDNTTESFGALIDKATWHDTEYGFKFPSVMTPSSEIWVDDVPANVYRWDYEDVCLAVWPMLGAWAVTDYPAQDAYLTESVHVKSVTYSSGDGTVFSGYTTDGRIWYMKKVLLRGGEVVHAKALVLIYPKSKQSEVEKLIGVVKAWK